MQSVNASTLGVTEFFDFSDGVQAVIDETVSNLPNYTHQCCKYRYQMLDQYCATREAVWVSWFHTKCLKPNDRSMIKLKGVVMILILSAWIASSCSNSQVSFSERKRKNNNDDINYVNGWVTSLGWPGNWKWVSFSIQFSTCRKTWQNNVEIVTTLDSTLASSVSGVQFWSWF